MQEIIEKLPKRAVFNRYLRCGLKNEQSVLHKKPIHPAVFVNNLGHAFGAKAVVFAA